MQQYAITDDEKYRNCFSWLEKHKLAYFSFTLTGGWGSVQRHCVLNKRERSGLLHVQLRCHYDDDPKAPEYIFCFDPELQPPAGFKKVGDFFDAQANSNVCRIFQDESSAAAE